MLCVVMSSWGGEGGVPSVVGKGISSGRGREGALLCLGGGVASTTLSPGVSHA